eukprot:GHVL01009889.1.p1 GENE.GHVL01009889.1~~GHVL01009889.1.p1  ORF type:complete len:436 (+),score=50.95 GHVL01009889.1:3786-5093(+)
MRVLLSSSPSSVPDNFFATLSPTLSSRPFRTPGQFSSKSRGDPEILRTNAAAPPISNSSPGRRRHVHGTSLAPVTHLSSSCAVSNPEVYSPNSRHESVFSPKMRGRTDITSPKGSAFRPSRRTNSIGMKSSPGLLREDSKPSDANPKARGRASKIAYKGVHSEGLWRDLPDYEINNRPAPAGMKDAQPTVEACYGSPTHTVMQHTRGHRADTEDRFESIKDYPKDIAVNCHLAPRNEYHSNGGVLRGKDRRVSVNGLVTDGSTKSKTTRSSSSYSRGFQSPSTTAMNTLRSMERPPPIVPSSKPAWVGSHSPLLGDQQTGRMHRPSVSKLTQRPRDNDEVFTQTTLSPNDYSSTSRRVSINSVSTVTSSKEESLPANNCFFTWEKTNSGGKLSCPPTNRMARSRGVEASAYAWKAMKGSDIFASDFARPSSRMIK